MGLANKGIDKMNRGKPLITPGMAECLNVMCGNSGYGGLNRKIVVFIVRRQFCHNFLTRDGRSGCRLALRIDFPHTLQARGNHL